MPAGMKDSAVNCQILGLSPGLHFFDFRFDKYNPWVCLVIG